MPSIAGTIFQLLKLVRVGSSNAQIHLDYEISKYSSMSVDISLNNDSRFTDFDCSVEWHEREIKAQESISRLERVLPELSTKANSGRLKDLFISTFRGIRPSLKSAAINGLI